MRDHSEQSALDFLGRTLMERVRDSSLRQLAKITKEGSRSPHIGKLSESVKAANLSPEQVTIIEMLVTEAVDQTIFNVLALLDWQSSRAAMQLLLHPTSNTSVDAAKAAGELTWQLYGKTGWLRRFSKYPTNWPENWLDNLPPEAPSGGGD